MQKTLEKQAITTKKPKHAGGRPSDYTKEKGDRICLIVSTSTLGLPKICSIHDDFPKAETVRRWRLEHEEFSAKYARAKLAQADILAEECLEIADNSTPENVTVDRLRTDTRKWLASKLLPKQYGDKMLLEQKTEENEQLKAELIELRAKLDEDNKREF
jgi:hypothetical protein